MAPVRPVPRQLAEIVQWLLQQHQQKPVRSCPNDTTAAPHLLTSTEIQPSSQRYNSLSQQASHILERPGAQWRSDEATLGFLRELTTLDLSAYEIVVTSSSTKAGSWASDNLSFLLECMPQLTSLDLRRSPDEDAYDQRYRSADDYDQFHRAAILNTVLMETIGKLTSLQVLRVGAVDCLAELAGALKCLTRLTELKLTVGVARIIREKRDTEVLGAKQGGHELLEAIESLPALRILHMDVQTSDNTMIEAHSPAIARSLAGALSGRKELADLNLHGHKFCLEGAMSLVNVLQSLPALTHLSMSVSEVPAGIGGLTALQEIDLWCVSLTELPLELGALVELQKMNLSGCKSLEKLPAGISGLTALREIDLSRCESLKELPAELGALKGLQQINLSECKSRELPAIVCDLIQLETLDLSNNNLRMLPREVGQLTRLRTLNLYVNSLEELPATVCDLMQLETLDVGNNNLRMLPREVGQLTRLRTLNLEKNKVEELSATVRYLMQLETLDLSNNNLRTLPHEVGQLTRLHTLNLDNNRLEKLPIVEIISNPTLDYLGCKYNKRLLSPPPEIAKQGGKAVVCYLRLASPQAGGILNRNVELFMVGNGECGKTSVLAMLKNGKAERIHEDQRTVGINMMDLDLSDEAEGLVFRTKDLAGQLVYGLSNQFFLVKRALYVLVWRIVPGRSRGRGHEGKSGEVVGESVDGKTTSEVAKEMVSTWLDNLQVRVPGASVLLVATHVDVTTQDEVEKQCRVVQTTVESKINELREDEKVTGIPSLSVWAEGSSFRVNCLEGTGASDLKGALIHMAHSLPCWGECIPRSFVLLKDKIEEQVKLQAKPWIFWEAYAQMARECGVDDCVYLQIVTRFLHDNAVLKFFGELPSRKVETVSDAVYIDPKWIMDTLKGLIRHNRQPLFDFFQSEKSLDTAERSKWKRRIHRLVSLGVLHAELFRSCGPTVAYQSSVHNTGHGH